jgi:pyrroloquinoline quinone biosynthesis protein D
VSDFTTDNLPRLATRTRLRHDPARDAEVLLYPEGVLVLNGSAAAILKLCDGIRSVGQIAEELSELAGVDVSNDVIALLDQLLARGLVEKSVR